MFMIFLNHFKGQEPIPTVTGQMWFLSMLGIQTRIFCFSADLLQTYTLWQPNNAILQKAILQIRLLPNSFSFQPHGKTLTLYLHWFPLDLIKPNDPPISVQCYSSAPNQQVSYPWQSTHSQDFSWPQHEIKRKLAQNGSWALTTMALSTQPQTVSLAFILMLVTDALWHFGPWLERNDMWPAQVLCIFSCIRLKSIKCILSARTWVWVC